MRIEKLYTFKAINNSNEIFKSCYRVSNDEELQRMLRKRGYYLLKSRVKYKLYIEKLSKKVSYKDIYMFCDKFYALYECGINIDIIFGILSTQTENKILKENFIKIKMELSRGMELNEILNAYPKIYPEFLVKMIYIGEQSGNLELILGSLSKYYERQYKLIKKIKANLIYPVFVFVTSIVVILFIIIKIIPIFSETLQSMGAALPIMTKFLLRLSFIIRNIWIYLVAALGVFIFLMIKMKKNNKIKQLGENIKFKLPFVKNIYYKLYFCNILNSLGTLLKSGESLIKSLEVVNKTISNKSISNKVRDVANSISDGSTATQAFIMNDIFDEATISIINCGEESGKLDDMFLKSSEILSEEIQNSIEKACALIGPILILILAFFVAIIIFSVMLPVLNIMDTI